MAKQTTSKKQLAYDSIKEMILNGELKTGEPIIERKLCESLGISRTPIRAAVQGGPGGYRRGPRRVRLQDPL